MRKQYLSLLTKLVASLEFLEGSLSDPIEARYRVTSKNCVQKEYVLALYVWSKTLLCHFNVPDARLLRVLLWLRTKEDVMRFYGCVVAEKDEEVCVAISKHSVAGIS